MSQTRVRWKGRPEAQDYTGALHFLKLLQSPPAAAKLIDALRRAKPSVGAAKDLLRAARLPVLSKDDPHVAADLKRIQKGKPLPPVLLVRGDFVKGTPLVIADGYHRICAIAHVDEDASIVCRIVSGTP